jgi:RNA polymerase sigma-70 factor (ECF subfamily)
MRETWEAHKASLVRSVGTLRAKSLFEELKTRREPLRRFPDAGSLLAHLNTPGGDLDEKDRIYRVLVELVQARGPAERFAAAMAWLGLWPGLDRIYRRRLREFAADPGALVSEVGGRFTVELYDLDLARVHRIAATLVLNVERDVREARKRAWAEERLRADLPEERDDDRDGADAASGRREVLASELLRTRGISELGQPPRLDPDEDLKALRTLLHQSVGDEADLLIGTALFGWNQRELGERLGLNHEVARKRYQGALKHAREQLLRD